MSRYDDEAYRKYPDNCERCSGTSGGVRGNENVIDGRVLCDYCSCEVDGTDERYDLRCSDCYRPLGEHTLVTIEEVENLWAEGIGISICHRQHLSSELPGMLLTWLGKNIAAPGEPDDPCDDDFMKDISS